MFGCKLLSLKSTTLGMTPASSVSVWWFLLTVTGIRASLPTKFPFNVTVTTSCQCPFVIDPVCGRIGNYDYTYINECTLNCSKRKEKVELLYKGACCRPTECSPFETPVCDDKGKMHHSPCAFELAQCMEFRLHGRHLGQDSTKTKCSCVTHCPMEWKPVCDNKGNTHASHCAFLNAKCMHKNQFNETLAIDYDGTCCEDMCITGHSTTPLCDSEGQTHSDLCSFYTAQCQNKRRSAVKKNLSVSHMGPCIYDVKNIRDTFHYFLQRFAYKM